MKQNILKMMELEKSPAEESQVQKEYPNIMDDGNQYTKNISPEIYRYIIVS